jgi:hypothetical protein
MYSLERMYRRKRKSMTVFPIKYKREGYKLAGTSLPLQAHNYLVLYTLAKGITKSKILTNLINNWIETQKGRQSEQKLIQDIVQRIESQWKVKKAIDKKLLFEEYKETLHEAFTDKGLTETQINLILKSVKER